MIGSRPFIGTALKAQRFRFIEFPVVFEIGGKPRSLNPRAKVKPRRAAKLDITETASEASPAPMIPWPEHDEVPMMFVEFLQCFISGEGAIEIFLIPPTAKNECRNGRRLEVTL